MEMIAGGVILLARRGARRGEWAVLPAAAVSARSLLALGYLIVAGSLLGFSAYVFLLGATTPARVSTYAYVNPVVAVFLGWLFAGEARDAADAARGRRDRRRRGAHHPPRRAPHGRARAEENVAPLRAQGGRR